ncbi:ABC transporter permease subunit [Rhizobium sp. P32RR-XVIII]|nr:ABC transporter permease subunit [Rhizobium sp. P32RR-XVIII]
MEGRFDLRRYPVAVGIATVAVLTVLLENALRLGLLNRYVVPLPSEVLLNLPRLFTEEAILQRFFDTGFRMLVSCILVVGIAVPTGALLWRYRLLRRAVIDWVAALAAAPVVLAFPLFLVMFGRSTATVVIMSLITGLAPLVIKTVEGLTTVRPVLINVGRSMRLSSMQMFWKILLPAALPAIFTGIKISWTYVLISVVGIEYLINLGGLGALINELVERYDLPGTYSSILLVVLLSVIYFMALERIEKWVRR